MNVLFKSDNNRLIRNYDSEKLWIEPWGHNSLRIRSTHAHAMENENWALLEQPEIEANITIEENYASIQNGKIRAVVTNSGKITIYNQKDKVLLEEYVRNRKVR